MLVIDEAHEGVDTTKTDIAFEKIKRTHTLHLSGTPFKALAKGRFTRLRSAPTTFAHKVDAERWLAIAEAELARGSFFDPTAGQVSVEEWSSRWLEAATSHLKIKTYAGYASLLKTKIVPRFGDLALSDIKPIMVSEWIADLRRQGLSPSRVRQSYRLLSQIMRAAVENDLIAVSPCRGVRLPRLPRLPQTEPHILTEHEVDTLVAMSRPPHDLLVMVLAYGGLRIGEALALRRASVDVIGGGDPDHRVACRDRGLALVRHSEESPAPLGDAAAARHRPPGRAPRLCPRRTQGALVPDGTLWSAHPLRRLALDVLRPGSPGGRAGGRHAT